MLDAVDAESALNYPYPYPLHLTATASVAPDATAGVNAIQLKNPIGAPMEILEIKFSVVQSTGTTGVDVSSTSSPILGGLVACKLDMGSFPLTNGYVPVWSFCRNYNGIQEGGFDNIVPASGVQNPVEYSWKLARPLYVPAGAVVLPSFQHRGLVNDTLNVRISYSARSVKPGIPPKRISLPYASAYVSKTFAIDNTLDSDTSTPTDIINPFAEPLNLQRVVGRCQVWANDLSFFTEGANGGGDFAPSQLLQAKIVDSFGRPIVRDAVVLRQIVSGLTRSWEMPPGITMDPDSFWIITMNKLSTTKLFISSVSVNAQTFISVVGWHDVVGGA